MRILLFITGHSQLEEYNYFSKLLNSLSISNICDVVIYCNNSNISSKIVSYYQQFNQTNKQLIITNKNSGYRIGGVEAVSNGFDLNLFNDYDYVIHLHPDVFIVDDNKLLTVLNENLNNDNVFLITKSLPYDNKYFSFDFFIFKPKLLTTNIFKEELYIFKTLPEYYLHDMILKNNIKYKFIERYNNNNWEPRRVAENLSIYHEHNLSNVYNLLHSKNLI